MGIACVLAAMQTQMQATQAIIRCGNELGLEVVRSPGVPPRPQQPPATQRPYTGQYSGPGELGPAPGYGMGQMGQQMSGPPERRSTRRYVPSPTLDTLPMLSPYGGPQPYTPAPADNYNPWRSAKPNPPVIAAVSSACVTLGRRPPQQRRDYYTVPRPQRPLAAPSVAAAAAASYPYDMGPSASATDPTPYWSSPPQTRDRDPYKDFNSATPYSKSSYSSMTRPSGPPLTAWPSSVPSQSSWADDRATGTPSTQESGYSSYNPSRGRGSVPPAEMSQPRRAQRASSCMPEASNDATSPTPGNYSGVRPGLSAAGGSGGRYGGGGPVAGKGKPPPAPNPGAGLPQNSTSSPPTARTGLISSPNGGAMANGGSGNFTSAPGKRLVQGHRGQAVLNTLDALNATVSVVPVCGVCHNRIRGPFVSALDKSYCPQHFYCQNEKCGANLMELGFVEEEGRLFCEHCYARFWAPRCGGCGQVVLETAVQAMGRAWHSGCFRCSACGRAIGPGAPFHVEDGRPFCTADFESLFTPKCDACSGPIGVGDRWVDACSKRFHAACFRCSTCSTTLDGKPFVNLQGKPYCRAHGAGIGRFGVVF